MVARTRRRVVLFATVASAMIACGFDGLGTGGPDGGDDPASSSGSSGGPGQPGQPGEAGQANHTALGEGGTIAIGNDAGAGVDAAKDSAVVVMKDAAPDGAIVYVCPGGNTTDCSTCGGGRTLGCVMCATSGTGIYAVCTPPGVSCYANYRPSGYTWCRCGTGNPSQCILPKQGCNPYDNGVCVTCGENATSGDPCKGGGSCNEGAAKCQ